MKKRSLLIILVVTLMFTGCGKDKSDAILPDVIGEGAQDEMNYEKYHNGVTYGNLTLTPEQYMDGPISFNGEVLEVYEGGSLNEGRLAIDGDPTKELYFTYEPNLIEGSLHEGDMIRLYGMFKGLLSDETNTNSIFSSPTMSVDEIMFN